MMKDKPEKDTPLISYDALQAAVLVFANNEAGVIASSVRSVLQALDPRDVIHVIADNCTDETASLAAAAGALVFERNTGDASGKAAALRWYVDQAGVDLDAYNLLVVLDADDRVPQDFLHEVKAGFKRDVVFQCMLQAVGADNSHLATLIALSENHEQGTLDDLRTYFGWHVRLRGTGMVIPPHLLKQVVADVDTGVEDLALSLLLSARGVPIRRNKRALVFDPKPSISMQASRQRARWFRGQWMALWRYRRQVGQLLLLGMNGWSLLDALFMKPRWLVDFLCLLIGLILLRDVCWLAFFFLARVLFDLLSLSWTIFSSRDRWKYMKAILHLPGFIWMWLWGIVLAFQKSSWLRARD